MRKLVLALFAFLLKTGQYSPAHRHREELRAGVLSSLQSLVPGAPEKPAR